MQLSPKHGSKLTAGAGKVAMVIALVAILAGESVVFAIGSKNAGYHGGTAAGFDGADKAVEGLLDTANANQLTFMATDKKFKGRTISISYKNIIDLEYGQKAGRRVGAAAATTVLFGPIGLLTLFSKKRAHFLTVGFKDDAGSDQVVVLELGKDIVRTSLAIVETRSGKKIEYQDDEARKAASK
jgi:hypothetical protein